MNIEQLEKELDKIHKSTGTLFRRFSRFHNKLRAKNKAYYRWHLFPYHKHIHYGVLVAYTIGVVIFCLSLFYHQDGILRSLAGGPLVGVTGKASVVNTYGDLDFNISPYGSDAMIDDETKQFEGYAWSVDLGWVAFGTENNVDGPVVIDATTGIVSGQAKVISTGNNIDFNSTPYGSNVLVNVEGNFAGFAWSEDVGWINFSGVKATGLTFISPSAPQNMRAYDVSDRNLNDYAVLVRWQEPDNFDSENFNAYLVERSSNGVDYVQKSATSSRAYYDTDVLFEQVYYYRVKAQNKVGSVEVSEVVTVTPTGKYILPPEMQSGSLTSSVGATGLSVSWTTTDSNHPCEPSVQIFELSSDNVVTRQGTGELTAGVNHSVRVTGLRSTAAYRYQALCRDVDGNTMESDKITFTTGAVPAIYDVTITDISLTSAVINFKTASQSTNKIVFSSSSRYENATTTGNTTGQADTIQSARLTNLTENTVYYFRILGTDNEGNEIRSENSFSTPARPAISSVKLQPIAEAPTTTYDVYWTTNVPTSSAVVMATSGSSIRADKSDLETNHVLRLSGLLDQSTYSITVSGRDQYGNECVYTADSVTTPIDTRPPKISNLIVEVKSSGFGQTQKAQVVVSWETDEPATSQVEYAQGISGIEYSNASKEDSALSNSHVVILSDLEPSKIYHLRAVSKDNAQNLGASDDTTVITGKMQSSILDIIINSLERSLGWVFKIFK